MSFFQDIPMLLYIALFLVSSIHQISSSSELDSSIAEFIQSQVVKLKPESFSDDHIVIQEVDSSEKSITYVHQASEIPLFHRGSLEDKGKSVVVLGQNEDRLLSCKTKNTFIVLRQLDDSNKENSYWILMAFYIDGPSGRKIEWDSWEDRGFAFRINKALLFGWTTCQSTSFIPCKVDAQTVLPENTIKSSPVDSFNVSSLQFIPVPGTTFEPLDYFCDLIPLSSDPQNSRFVALTVDTMINSMVILSATQLIYQNEEKLVGQVAEDMKMSIPSSEVTKVGRSFFGNANEPDALDLASEVGAKKLLEKGREGIAKAVLMLDTSISRVGAVSTGVAFESILASQVNLSSTSNLGKSLLRGLFEGASTEDKDEKFINPNPKALLKDEVVEDLVFLRKISGDRFLGRLFGFSFGGAEAEQQGPPQETGYPVKITLDNGKVLDVTSVEGGMYIKDKYIKGEFVPAEDNPSNVNFIPEDKLLVLSVPIEIIRIKDTVKATEEQISKGVPITITSQAGKKLNILGVEGGMILNKMFFQGKLVPGSSPNEIRFASSSPYATSDDLSSSGGSSSSLSPSGIPLPKVGEIGYGSMPMNVYISGVEKAVLSVQGGIMLNDKFIPGEIRPGSGGRAEFVPQSADGSAPPPPSDPTPPPLSKPTLPPVKHPASTTPVAFTFYMSNSTTGTPLIIYVVPRGFLFYGLFFPGRIIEDYLPTYYIEIQGQVFIAVSIDRSRIKKGLMYPPMPPVYTITFNGQPRAAYFIEIGFLIEGVFYEGRELPGESSVELKGKKYQANLVPPGQAPVMPPMAGAYLIIIQTKQYLAYIVYQGVLIGGVFIPAQIKPNGIVIKNVLYEGSYISFVELKTQVLYTVTMYYEVRYILEIIGQIEGAIQFNIQFEPATALLVEAQVVVTQPIVSCPVGQKLIAPLGIPAVVANQLMTRDFESDMMNEMLNWKPHMKTGSMTGSKGVDNALNILNNAVDWYGDKSAGETFQENLIGGFWTPFGLIDDAVDAIGWVTGAGKVSDDYGYVDDLLGVAFSGINAIGGVAGKIIDGVGTVLNPIGLGGIWKSVAGVASGAIGIVAGAKVGEFYGAYDVIKVSAKTLHLGWLLGLRGSESEKKQKEMEEKIKQLNSVKAYLIAHPPTCDVIQVTPGTMTVSGSMSVMSAPAPPPAGLFASFTASFGRKKRSTEDASNTPVVVTDVDLFSHVGWKTINVRQDALMNFSSNPQQKDPFIGVGACEYEQHSLKDLEIATSPKDLVTFYMRALRTQCLKGQKDGLLDLVKFKHLHITPEKTFALSSKLIDQNKLSPQEMETLSRAFEFSIFSKTYNSLLKSPSSSSAQLINSLSLRTFVMNYLSSTATEVSQHAIKLIRNLLKTLQSILIKSLQDFYRYKYCPKCGEDLIRSAMDDPLEILGLMTFISSTNPSISKTSTGADQLAKDYDDWLTSNNKKDQLKLLLQSYLV